MARQKVKGLQAGGVYAPRTPSKVKRRTKIVPAERLEMKGTLGPYNPRRVRPKKRIPTITNLEKLRKRVTETGPSTRLHSAVKKGSERAEEERKRKKEKEKGRATRKKEVKETPFGLRTKEKGKAILSDAAKEQLAKTKTARQKRIKEAAIREAARKRRAPVTRKELPPPPAYNRIKHLELQKTLADNEEAKRKAEAKRIADEEFIWKSSFKTGGKVSRRKGGTVSRRGGGPIEHDGNRAVSDGYDKIKI